VPQRRRLAQHPTGKAAGPPCCLRLVPGQSRPCPDARELKAVRGDIGSERPSDISGIRRKPLSQTRATTPIALEAPLLTLALMPLSRRAALARGLIPYDKDLHKERHLIGRFINKIKH
jgi:hypothetical protein